MRWVIKDVGNNETQSASRKKERFEEKRLESTCLFVLPPRLSYFLLMVGKVFNEAGVVFNVVGPDARTHVWTSSAVTNLRERWKAMSGQVILATVHKASVAELPGLKFRQALPVKDWPLNQH